MGKQLVVVLLLLSLFILGQTLQHKPRQYHHLPLGFDAVGPESITFDCEGRGPYVGVSDGRILRWENHQAGWTEFGVTSPYRTEKCNGVDDSPMEQYCGRPLGLKFNTVTCELYVTDSSLGLVKIGRNGGVATSVATSAEGIPFRFLNDLDIDSEGGSIYFSDTGSHFNRWDYGLALVTEDQSGRLIKYDLATKKLTVLLRGLFFANGVALSKNKDFVLVVESSVQHIRRLWLTGPKAGLSEVFLHVNGLPDNINRNEDGDFWIAQNPNAPIKVNADGKILEALNPKDVMPASDITEVKNTLWIGSVIVNYLVYTT